MLEECGSLWKKREIVKGRLDALQMVRESVIDCFTGYKRDQTDMSFLCYHGSVRGDKGK